MDQCNIIICTPGRLLQHMDENPLFNCVNMQVSCAKLFILKLYHYMLVSTRYILHYILVS
jgi:hypothetical protein